MDKRQHQAAEAIKYTTPLTASPSEVDNIVVMTALLGLINHGFSLTWLKMIFSFLGPNTKDTHHLRCFCRLFRNALKPLPLWTSFPHPKYPTLNCLIDRLNDVYKINPKQAPTILFVMQGTFHSSNNDDNNALQVVIRYPIKLIGAGQSKTIFCGYSFWIGGLQEEGKRVKLKGMTVKGSGWHGLYGNGGLFFLCDSMTFTQCGQSGVYAYNTKGRLRDCMITQCGRSGIISHYSALIEMEGNQTKVHGNGNGNGTRAHNFHGLYAVDSSSSIHLLSPLTKESVFTIKNGNSGSNCGGFNYGGDGIIQTVDSLSNH